MNYYTEIKEILINNEINKKVKDYSKNKVELESYYSVGKMLFEAGKHYGEGIIKEYSIKLTIELGKGYSWRNLYNMRSFYVFIEKNTILQPLVAKLKWTQICTIINLDDIDKQKYYLNLSVNNILTKRELQKRIKEREYERLPESTKEKLKTNKELSLVDTIKDPILIKSNNLNVDNIKEKTLQKLILDDLNNFLSQLGKGYSYIQNEYKIKVGNTYNYIDILLYNVIYHSYVVVELKVTPLKKEHIGQIEVYVNYIDFNLKGITDNKTIGLIVTKENNEYIIKYSSDKRIKAIEYNLEVIK